MNVLKLMIFISFLQMAQANPLVFMNRAKVSEKFQTRIAEGSKILFSERVNINGTHLNLRSVEVDENGFVMTFVGETEFKKFIRAYIVDYSPWSIVFDNGDVILKIVSTESDVIMSEVEKLVDAYKIFLHKEKVLHTEQGKFIAILNQYIKGQGNFLPRLEKAEFINPTTLNLTFNYNKQFREYLSGINNEKIRVTELNKTSIILTLDGSHENITDNLVTVVFGFKDYLKNRVRIK